jgi:hypothetical protein
MLMVPRAGLEPAWPLALPRNFKSLVSTSFTTRAERHFIVARDARVGIDCGNGKLPAQTTVAPCLHDAKVSGAPCTRERSRGEVMDWLLRAVD